MTTIKPPRLRSVYHDIYLDRVTGQWSAHLLPGWRGADGAHILSAGSKSELVELIADARLCNCEACTKTIVERARQRATELHRSKKS